MSTQQDIYAAGSESRPLMLNKENYVPWSSRLLQYAKSRPNGKLIHNSILNGPYVRKMIPEPGDANCEITVTETFHLQTDDELSDKELKQIEADDQAIQTILLGLPEDIYAATKDLYTANYTQLYDFLKYNQKEVDELKAERLAKTQDPLALMANSNNPYAFPAPHKDQSSFNQNYLQQPMPNPKDITDPTTVMNMALVLMAKAFKLNYSTPTNNNQRISSNPRNRQIAQPGMNMGQDRQMQMVRARAEGNAVGQNGNQIRCYNYREVDLDKIEEVNANCILMANLQQASTSGTQTDSASVYDTDGSAENDNDVISEDTSVEQGGETVEQHPVNFEETRALYESLYQNLAIKVEKVNSEQCLSKMINALHVSTGKQIMALNEQISDLKKQLLKEKSTVSFLLEEKKRLNSDFKTCEDKLLDKQIQLEKKIKELNNIVLKTGQSIQTILMLSPKPYSFYHTEQKMALGYQDPFYRKQAQKKQQSLYDGKVLLEKHDPPVVHDSEETLQLTQESREKMKQMNKEIKPSNGTKINHLLRVFVLQTALSREELYFSNNSKTANDSKSISIPNEDFLDDTTPSVARKFLNEVKSTIVTLQHVVKQRMTIETHNYSFSAHQELYKIEAAKFAGDFKSLANEADASLAKHKALELEIERLLKAVVSQDIMIIVQNESVVDTSDLQTKLEHTQNPLSQKLKNENVELEFQVLNYARENAHLKATYKNLFDSISMSRAQTKTIITSLQNELQSNIYKNAKLRTQLFKKVSDQKGNTQDTRIDNTKTRRPQPRSNTKNDRVPSASKSSRSQNKEAEVEEHHRNLLLSKNNKHISSACNNIKIDSQDVISKFVCVMCKKGLIFVNHDKCLSNYVNGKNSCGKNQKAKVSVKEIQKWSPTGRLFNQEGKIVDSIESKSKSDCSNGNLKLLINFVWKFMGTVRFENDHVAAILGFSDLQWGNILITRVYFVEGLGHNLFSVGQFCDLDLEVAFRSNACFVRNLEGVDLLKGDHSTNLYIINLHEMASASPICLMARASPTKSWLWHQRLFHLNFDTIMILPEMTLS
nr:integrase, catalytic region, zinc finger, CCHC-type, peptidase aspartic, catalytic [Tanacetum cinerariifolium]